MFQLMQNMKQNEAWEDAKRGKVCAIFREDTVLDAAASRRAGRDIYKPVILIEKFIPGDTLNRPVRPMRESDKEEYPQEWARFQQKDAEQTAGTALEKLTWLTRSQIAEFRALNILTVEHLATLPDSVAGKIMGFREIRGKAEAFLKSSQDTALAEQLQAELKQRDDEMKKRDEEIASLRASIEALTKAATPQRKRGRPKKVAA